MFLLTAGDNDKNKKKETDSNNLDRQNLQQNHAESAMLLPSCAFVVRNVHLCQSLPPVGAQIIPAARSRGLVAADHQHSNPSAAAATAKRSVQLSVLSTGGMQAGLFCPNTPTAAQAKVPEPQRSALDGGFSFIQIDRCGSESKPFAPSRMKSADSLFVTWRILNFLCYTGSLFCTVTDGHMNPGSCVFYNALKASEDLLPYGYL